MNIVFLYGPPAAGKLTIGTELAGLIDYRLFHNHLTQDLAKDIYPAFDSVRFDLVHRLRCIVFEYAATRGTNLITTYVHDGGKDDEAFVNDTIQIVQQSGGGYRSLPKIR